jgi:hypothetical protein
MVKDVCDRMTNAPRKNPSQAVYCPWFNIKVICLSKKPKNENQMSLLPIGEQQTSLIIKNFRKCISIARYDQMLKNMHNSEILLAP